MMTRLIRVAAVIALFGGLGAALPSPATAVLVNQIDPVAVYHDTTGAFGMAHDSVRKLIWYTQGDAGDSLIHSLKPFNEFTPGELAGLPDIGGVKQISLVAGQHDVAGTTNPVASGGAHFRSLAYDAAIDQLVMQGPAVNLHSFDPLTAGNLNANYRPGHATNSFSDGLDIEGNTTWYSPDASNIFKNGVLFASTANADQTLQVADGLLVPPALGEQGLGWSGTEEAAGRLWAVAVLTNADSGRSRTIVAFDPATGELLSFDPDGDPVAARWEDLAFDGRFLYAADLRGNADDLGPVGDIYVFDIVGPGGLQVVEPGSLALVGAGLLGLGGVAWRRRRP